jgi:titin
MKLHYVFMYQVRFSLIYSIRWLLLFAWIDVPGAPRDAQVDSVSDDSVSLSWRPPEEDGGSYITNYVIEKLEPDTGKWVKAATSRSPRCTVENLLPNKQYQFRILAENIFGAGEPSEPTKTVQTSGRNLKKNY